MSNDRKTTTSQHKIFIPSLENTFLYWAKIASCNFQIIGLSSLSLETHKVRSLFFMEGLQVAEDNNQVSHGFSIFRGNVLQMIWFPVPSSSH